MSHPSEHFRHCPSCGRASIPPLPNEPMRCGHCDFLYFFNAATAVGAFAVRSDGQSLWLRRAKDPGRGKLGVPGGFVDIGETVEAALEREVREETGLRFSHARFFCSEPNAYRYGAITYPVCDLFFEVRIAENASITPQDEEVAEWQWRRPREVQLDSIAFDSVRRSFSRWRNALVARASGSGTWAAI